MNRVVLEEQTFFDEYFFLFFFCKFVVSYSKGGSLFLNFATQIHRTYTDFFCSWISLENESCFVILGSLLRKSVFYYVTLVLDPCFLNLLVQICEYGTNRDLGF